MTPPRLSFCAAAAILCTARAGADTLFGTLGQNSTVGVQLLGTTTSVATDFATPGGGDWLLTSVTLLTRNGGTTPDILTLRIFNNVAGRPGNPVGSFTPMVLPPMTNFGNVTTLSPGITISGQATYWLVAQFSQASTQGMDWLGTSSQATDAGSVFTTTPVDVQFGANNGTSYSRGFTGNMQYSLGGNLVPEPTSTVLLLGGAVLLGLRRRG